MSPRDRAYLESYARGVNAFIDSHRDRLSLEFRVLKYAPKPWTATDSLLVGARMVQDLNHYSYGRALTREKILARLGPELTADLYVNSSWRDRPPAAARPRMDEEEPAVSSDEGDEDDDDGEPVGEGSSLISSFSAPEEDPDVAKLIVGDLLDDLLGAAREQHASDVHLIAGRPALFRIAGELVAKSEPLDAANLHN